MNILYISNGVNLGRFKYKYGFSFTHNNLKALSINNKVMLVTYADFDKEEMAGMNALNKICTEVVSVRRKEYSRSSHRMLRMKCFFKNELILSYKDRSSEMRSKLEDLDKQGGFDVAIYDGYGLAQYANCIKRIPKIYYLMDSLTLRERENLKSPVIKILDRLESMRLISKIEDFEKNSYVDFSRCIVATEKDKDTILGLNPRLNIATVPLCVDTEYFKRPSSEDENLIIFVGVLWTEHNVDAVRYFYHDILPLVREKNKNVTLLLVGGTARKDIKGIAAEDPGVKLIDFVEDIRPYLGRGTVFVSPMRIGSGMNNKLLEAMSMAKAIVTTEHGNRGIGLKDGLEAMVCKNKFAFADAVTKLLKDKEMRGSLGANARRRAEQDFSIEAYSRRLQQTIDGVALHKKSAYEPY